MRTKRAKQLKRFTLFLQKWSRGNRPEITYKAVKKAYMKNKQTLLRDLKRWEHALKNRT